MYADVKKSHFQNKGDSGITDPKPLQEKIQSKVPEQSPSTSETKTFLLQNHNEMLIKLCAACSSRFSHLRAKRTRTSVTTCVRIIHWWCLHHWDDWEAVFIHISLIHFISPTTETYAPLDT